VLTHLRWAYPHHAILEDNMAPSDFYDILTIIVDYAQIAAPPLFSFRWPCRRKVPKETAVPPTRQPEVSGTRHDQVFDFAEAFFAQHGRFPHNRECEDAGHAKATVSRALRQLKTAI
jgi:hypothetical protein